MGRFRDDLRRACGFALLAAAWTGTACAADASAAADNGVPDNFFLNELRLGVFAHDPLSPERAGGVDLNAEVLFDKPWGEDAAWWAPRPHLGATVNFEGRTSTVYGGATWQFDLTRSLFAEASFGASLNNAGGGQGDENSALGCPVLFRTSASLGYRLTAQWNILASIEHNSNAGLCDRNRGLTNAGLRLGYRF